MIASCGMAWSCHRETPSTLISVRRKSGPSRLRHSSGSRLGPRRLQAQACCIPDQPYLPSNSWWRHLSRVSDRALARVVHRVSRLVRGDPPVLDAQWREAWRELLVPRLLAEVQGRRRRPHRARSRQNPPIDVLETMRRLTGEEGRERRGEVWFHCPFHPDRTPSLSVNVEKQVFKCLGCGEGGGWKRLGELAA